MLVISRRMSLVKAKGGVLAKLAYAGLQVLAAVTFVRMFVMRPKRHELPADIRMVPTW